MNLYLWIAIYSISELSAYLSIYYLYAKDKLSVHFLNLSCILILINIGLCELFYGLCGYNSVVMIPTLVALLIPLLAYKGERINLLLFFPIATIIPGLFKEVLRYIIFMVSEETPNFDGMTTINLLTKIIPLLFLLTYVTIRRNHHIEYSKIQMITTSVGLICASAIISANYTLVTVQNLNENAIIIIGIFESILCIIFLIISHWQGILLIKNHELKERESRYQTILDEQQKYFEQLIYRDEETRHFRHDLKAHITVLRGLANKSDNKDLLEYVNEMEENADIYKTMAYTGITQIDAILNSLVTKMECLSIPFTYNGLFPTIDSFSVFDICTILYNLINNAIEASEKIDSEDRHITLHFASENNRLFISISNNCNLPNMADASHMATDKNDYRNHGFGILNTRRAVEKYDGLFKQYVKEKIFYSEVIL